MFKRKKPETPTPVVNTEPPAPAAPTRTPEEIEARRQKMRGDRLADLANEARMWRRFATRCEDGRTLREQPPSWQVSPSHVIETYNEAALGLTMDVDTAQLWRDFALRMADERERRLRDALGTP